MLSRHATRPGAPGPVICPDAIIAGFLMSSQELPGPALEWVPVPFIEKWLTLTSVNPVELARAAGFG
jgi:hypothetical protein